MSEQRAASLRSAGVCPQPLAAFGRGENRIAP